MRRLCAAGFLAGLCVITACSSPGGTHAASPGSPPVTPRATGNAGATGATVSPASPAVPSSQASPAVPSSQASPAVPSSQAASALAQPPPAPGVTTTRMRLADGSVVTVATFRGPVQYVLHNGSGDPGAAAAGVVRAGPAVTGSERKRLLAAFNGGFKLGAGVGGYEQEGHVISPLHRGYASLVIDRSGRASIGIWGSGVPEPGQAVYSVRQNLQPLVMDSKPTGAASEAGLWGSTLGGGEYVARSAVGQSASGDLIYAASMSAAPADLAVALARGGARIAMELDINPEWVQLDVARQPGGPLRAAVPGQNRPADQYLYGWARDFFTVLAPSAGPQARYTASRQLRP